MAGRIRAGVHTDDGIYEADSVILCAGFGSRKIMRTVGLDVPYAASADRGVRHRSPFQP